MLFLQLPFSGMLFSQTSSMYVSLKDGKSNIFRLRKVAYNEYYFTTLNSDRDTLICSGEGLELPKAKINGFGFSSEDKTKYKKFNKAIRKAQRKIRRQKSDNGNIAFSFQKTDVVVDYKKYSNQRVEMIVELVE